MPGWPAHIRLRQAARRQASREDRRGPVAESMRIATGGTTAELRHRSTLVAGAMWAPLGDAAMAAGSIAAASARVEVALRVGAGGWRR